MPEDFFKPLTSIHKTTFIDCLGLINDIYKEELSFGVDRDVILEKLEQYFEGQSNEDVVFDEDENMEVLKDARSKAHSFLRRLKECGWLEYETVRDNKVNVNLFDYATTMIESFNKIMNNEEIEYESFVSEIHGTLLNEIAYKEPYKFVIKPVVRNTEELIGALKKLNTNIKRYIEDITSDKTAGEIVEDFFKYRDEIGSKAYHRIKTSENISHFRTTIIERLYYLLDDKVVFSKAVSGYMEIEQIEDKEGVEESLKNIILNVIEAFRKYDDIILEIDYKNTKYMENAVARAKFLLSNTNNVEGKISTILAKLAEEFNKDPDLDLSDEANLELMKVFNIFPQEYIENDSLYTLTISKKMATPERLRESLGISDEERKRRKQIFQEKNKNRFSKKNINGYIDGILDNENTVLASTLPLESKRDLIRIVFINFYGQDKKSTYKTTATNKIVEINNFKFPDFLIERGKS